MVARPSTTRPSSRKKSIVPPRSSTTIPTLSIRLSAMFSNLQGAALDHLALLDRQVAVDEVGADPVVRRFQALPAEPAQLLEHDQTLLAQFVGDHRTGDGFHRAWNRIRRGIDDAAELGV